MWDMLLCLPRAESILRCKVLCALCGDTGLRITVLKLCRFSHQSSLLLFAHLSSLGETYSKVSCCLVMLQAFLPLCFCCYSQQHHPFLPFLPCRALSSFQALWRCLLSGEPSLVVPHLFPASGSHSQLLPAESWLLGSRELDCPCPMRCSCAGSLHWCALMHSLGIEWSDHILGLPFLACVNNCPLHVSFGSMTLCSPYCLLFLRWFLHFSPPLYVGGTQGLCPVYSLPGPSHPSLSFHTICEFIDYFAQLRACDFEYLDKIL